jgi:hypothetical protein
MTSKEEAELFFKQEPRSGGPRSIPEYEQRARAERTKIAKLRVLRLSREAALVTESLDSTFRSERAAFLSPKTICARFSATAARANGSFP